MNSVYQKIKNFICDSFIVLIHPHCWMQLYKYCPKWDKLINEAAEIGIIQFTSGSYWARIERQKPDKDIEIWVVNHPFASFTSYPTMNQEKRRPSRATIIRLGKLYEKELKEANT